ncbi:response regulator [Flavobacterium sp.]|uniref:response regulator n=1 Tax=Flavobacterium sp. TaxID=239 RepID=UPI003751FE57
MLNQITPKFETIMVIDDNKIDLYINSRIITQNKFAQHVLQYSSAKEALNYLSENQENTKLVPNIIFIDIYMPEMSGFEFMKIFNKFSIKLKDKCTVYIISSTNNEKDIDQINANKNIKSFHEKPLTKEFLESIN